jgi:hypothetical protein
VIIGLYEAHARDQFDTRLINKTIDSVLSDLSRKDIWREVQRQVIEKRAIRERLHVSLKILRAEDFSTAEDPIELDPQQMVLSMHMEYDLYGLRSLPSQVNIVHHLNKTLKAKKGKLPRFDFVHINGGPNLKEEVNDHHEFNEEIMVDSKENRPIHVAMCKKEVIYIPGNHSLTLTEMTKGIELTLLGAPQDLEVFFSLRPHAEDQALVENPPQAIRFDDEIMLPGQTIEFLFRRKEFALSPSMLKSSLAAQNTPDFQRGSRAFKSDMEEKEKIG